MLTSSNWTLWNRASMLTSSNFEMKFGFVIVSTITDLLIAKFFIYKFLSSKCNITYYGETQSHLKVRAGEYISTSPLTGERVRNNKNLPSKTSFFCQVTCVDFMVLPSWIISHISLNVWLQNLHLLRRIIEQTVIE